MGWIGLFFAFLAGAANPFQSATNAELNRQLGQPLWAGLTVYLTGLIGLLAMLAFAREALPVDRMGEVHWWAWTGGLISIAATTAGLMLAQKLGSALFTGVSLTASVITSVLLDQFGLAGMRQHAASPLRLLGCALLVGGIWLIAKF